LGVSQVAQDPAAATQALGLTTVVATVQADGARWQADAEVAGTRVGELNGRWIVQSSSPAALPTPESPLQGQVHAHVADLNVWGAWLPPGWRLGGELRTDLALSGRWGAPHLTGDLAATKLAVRNALEGVYGHDGDVEIRLSGDQARIERFRLRGGNGELTIAGDASLGASPAARLKLHAAQFQLLGRIDRKIVTSGDVDLALGADAIKVTGKLGIDEGLIDISKGDAPTLDSDVQVLDGSADSSDDTPAAPAAPRTGRATTIALDLALGDQLHLRGRGIDTFLRGDLQISAPNGLLAVRGTIRTNGGQYIAYGQKLQVTRGELVFTGIVNDPRLDILATRPNLDVTVGVAITGTALAPHVKLVSEPEMSDADKLSWLMLGRAPDTLGGADTALLQQAAIALLAGEGEGPTDQILNRLGLTDFGVGQKTDANDVKQTVVTLGRQISRRVYIGYERGVNATTGNWQLIYRIAQRLTVRAQSGEDNAADVIYTWRWN
ncbi:MAG TPA: translocation/assembly module TamB domain-containing protein, partial [Burkholderiaceae bacterium]